MKYISKYFSVFLRNIFKRCRGMPLQGHLLAARILISKIKISFSYLLSKNREKFDITEEKVRLKNHLNYFREVMENDFPNGKKLGFISQEIGREINTIGSKANHTELQKIVVQMKDELEKIKEQLLNIL